VLYPCRDEKGVDKLLVCLNGFKFEGVERDQREKGREAEETNFYRRVLVVLMVQ